MCYLIITYDQNVCMQVRENILFGSKFEASRYWKTVDVTALEHDLDILPVKCPKTIEHLSSLINIFCIDL